MENGYSEIVKDKGQKKNKGGYFKKGKANKYMSFNYLIFNNGKLHYLAIKLECKDDTGQTHTINLDADLTTYFFSLINAPFTTGQHCLDLHTNLEKVTGGKCDYFDIVLQVGASGSKLCVTGQRFHDKVGGHGCRKL